MAAPTNTYNSTVDLSIAQVPTELEEAIDPALYQELLDIHNALERIIAAFTDGTSGILIKHETLLDVTPNQHHPQVHKLYGTDATAVNQHEDVGVGAPLVTGSVLTYIETADGGEDKFAPVNIFTAAGYGGVGQAATPVGLPDLGVGFITLPTDEGTITVPAGVDQDFANDGLRFNTEGIWLVTVIISVHHTESNSGRDTTIRLWDDTAQVGSNGINIPIARNQPGTLVSLTLMAEISAAAVGNLFQAQLGGGDAITAVFLDSYIFSASHVSEFKG